jgi:hypothetical protein
MTRIINFSGKFWNRTAAATLKLFITMIFSRIKDSIIQVALPLCLGTFIYLAGAILPIPVRLKNYVPDALWAYALASALLIIWDRKPHSGWLISGVILLFLVELFQYLRVIPGQADYIDLIVYLLAYVTAILLNHFFKQPTNEKK